MTARLVGILAFMAAGLCVFGALVFAATFGVGWLLFPSRKPAPASFAKVQPHESDQPSGGKPVHPVIHDEPPAPDPVPIPVKIEPVIQRGVCPAIGEIGVVFDEKSDKVYLLSTMRDFEALSLLRKAKDTVGIERMVEAGKLFVLDQNTKVLVIRLGNKNVSPLNDDFWAIIRIKEGPYKDQLITTCPDLWLSRLEPQPAH